MAKLAWVVFLCPGLRLYTQVGDRCNRKILREGRYGRGAGRCRAWVGRYCCVGGRSGRALSEFSTGEGVGRYGRASCCELAVGVGRY